MVSVVIPTRNRKHHIKKALASIENQSLWPDEVLIVDSSDDTTYQREILQSAKLNVSFLSSEASVCIQRNAGIRAAKGDWILLLDDDIEIEDRYIETLVSYTSRNPECGAVAGRLMQLEGGEWVDQYPPPSYASLLFKFVFQLPVWGDIFRQDVFSGKIFANKVEEFYRKRGNSFTKAGWPLITSWQETFTTSIYSLGADLVRRDWLLRSPYDEILDKNGIGDNYGVAIGFPGSQSIHVLSTVKAFHYRADENRLQKHKAYLNRLFALQYFITRSRRFNHATIKWFYWSLIGNTLYFLTHGALGDAARTLKACTLMIAGRNPYMVKAKATSPKDSIL